MGVTAGRVEGQEPAAVPPLLSVAFPQQGKDGPERIASGYMEEFISTNHGRTIFLPFSR